ncbi:hypothetical protein [Haloarcula amylolytica]|uniref:hypothetical protein n=1 Tax=Haloarcula amylolytica TaxID=396317 RepID=UPI003C745427
MITGGPDDQTIEEYARENKEELIEILRHSSDTMGRAMAWTILDRGLSDPEFEQLEQEFEHLKRQRGLS